MSNILITCSQDTGIRHERAVEQKIAVFSKSIGADRFTEQLGKKDASMLFLNPKKKKQKKVFL